MFEFPDLPDGPSDVIVQAPFEDLNPLWRPAYVAFCAPLQLSAQLGRLSEARAQKALAAAYGEGCVMGSNDPRFDNFSTLDWREWLEGHPWEFGQIRSFAELRDNWTRSPAPYEPIEPPAVPAAGDAPITVSEVDLTAAARLLGLFGKKGH